MSSIIDKLIPTSALCISITSANRNYRFYGTLGWASPPITLSVLWNIPSPPGGRGTPRSSLQKQGPASVEKARGRGESHPEGTQTGWARSEITSQSPHTSAAKTTEMRSLPAVEGVRNPAHPTGPPGRGALLLGPTSCWKERPLR